MWTNGCQVIENPFPVVLATGVNVLYICTLYSTVKSLMLLVISVTKERKQIFVFINALQGGKLGRKLC